MDKEGYDRAFTALRSDPHAALDRLATETGGFLVETTNNLAGGIDRWAQVIDPSMPRS